MRSSTWRTWRSRLPRLAPACLLLALVLLISACGSTATITVANGQPTATATGGSGLPTTTATTGLEPTATTGTGGSTVTPTHTPSLPPPAIADYFVWTATASNISSHITTIDNPNTNNKPNAIVIVTPRYNPNNVYDNHPIGVWYTAGKWTIFNQDGGTMPVNAAFSVKVFSAGSGVFQWTAASATITGNWANITASSIPAGSSAVLLVTPVYNPHNVYDNHPIGVWYTSGHWTIFNQDGAAMPANAAFNVASVVGTGGSVFIHTATSSNITGNVTVISLNSTTDGHPNAVLECTQIYNPDSVYNVNNIGVWYNGSHWTIFNQRTPPAAANTIPQHASFNCATYGG